MVALLCLCKGGVVRSWGSGQGLSLVCTTLCLFPALFPSVVSGLLLCLSFWVFLVVYMCLFVGMTTCPERAETLDPQEL